MSLPVRTFNYSKKAKFSDFPLIQSYEPESYDGTLPSFASGRFSFLDLNSDGLTDLLARHSSEDQWYAWTNRGDGSFDVQSIGDAFKVLNLNNKRTSLADINGDQKSDLVLQSSDRSVKYFRNLGSINSDLFSTLESIEGEISASEGDTFVDLNGDSKVEYVKYLSDSVNVYYNTSKDGNVSFDNAKNFPVHSQLRKGSSWGDINGDGLPDLYKIVKESDGSTLLAQLNNGKGWIEPGANIRSFAIPEHFLKHGESYSP